MDKEKIKKVEGDTDEEPDERKKDKRFVRILLHPLRKGKLIKKFIPLTE